MEQRREVRASNFFSALSSKCNTGKNTFLKKSWNYTLTYTNDHPYNANSMSFSLIYLMCCRITGGRSHLDSFAVQPRAVSLSEICFFFWRANKMRQAFAAVTQPETTFTLPGCCRAVCWFYFLFFFPSTTTRSIPSGEKRQDLFHSSPHPPLST